MGNLFADIRIPIVAGGHEAFDGVSRPNTEFLRVFEQISIIYMPSDCDAHNVGTVYPNCVQFGIIISVYR